MSATRQPIPNELHLSHGAFTRLLPLLIHLIMMRHNVEWAAMGSLASYKNPTLGMAKQLLLLLRVFIIGLIVAMLAQWDPGKSWLTRFGAKETHHFLLLDDSYSMGELANGNTAFDRALTIVGRISSQASERSNQRFTLLRFSKASGATALVEEIAEVTMNNVADFSGAFVDSDFPERLSDRQKDMILTQADNGPLPALQLLQTLMETLTNIAASLISDFRQNVGRTLLKSKL